MIHETERSSSAASFSRASLTAGSTWNVIFNCFGIPYGKYRIEREKNQVLF